MSADASQDGRKRNFFGLLHISDFNGFSKGENGISFNSPQTAGNTAFFPSRAYIFYPGYRDLR